MKWESLREQDKTKTLTHFNLQFLNGAGGSPKDRVAISIINLVITFLHISLVIVMVDPGSTSTGNQKIPITKFMD